MNTKRIMDYILSSLPAITVFFIFTILFFLYFTIIINIQFGIDNLGMIGIYSDDEAAAVRLLMVNLNHNHLNPSGFYNYGYIYHSITFYIVKVLHYLGYEITEQLVAYVFRFISSFAYLLSLFILYLIGVKLQISRVLMLLMMLLFASTANLHFWAQTIHPDTLQILFIELAILLLVMKSNVWTIMLAAVVLGVAFGVKYSSIFLLPFLGLFSLYFFGLKQYKQWILYSVGLIVVFIGTWLLLDPYVYSNFDAFLEDFLYESQHVAYGHGKAESTQGLLWFSLLYQELGLWQTLALLFGLSSFGIFFQKILAKQSKELKYLLIILVLYVLATFVYMYIAVNMRRIRYIFHILPFVYLFAALGYTYLIRYFKYKYFTLLFIPLTLIAGYSSIITIKKTTHMSKKGNHNYIRAYNYIAERYSKDQFVLADYYSYKGKYFSKYKSVWGVSDKHVKTFSPDIIIINKLLSGRWYWKYDNTKFNELKLYDNTYDGHEDYYLFAKKLFAKKTKYKVVFELEDIVILHKKD